MFDVALMLTIMWGISYLCVRSFIKTGIVMFVMLFCMSVPSFFEPLFLEYYIENTIDYNNIFLLGIIMIVGAIPWFYFDKHIGLNAIIRVNEEYIGTLKLWFTVCIIGSIFAIIYLAPYALRGLAMGAADVRELIQDKSPLPESPLTTIAVMFATLHIYNVLFFFISYTHNAFRRYRLLLFLSSLSYIVSCMAITARDGFIILPLLYIIFYLIFRNSIERIELKSIKRKLSVILIGALLLVSTFTLSRFWFADRDTDRLLDGSVGYIAQQPYVFDTTVQFQDDFHGFELRFPLLNRLMGIEEYEIDRLDTWFETCFGTMYADFYSMGGWLYVIGVLAVFVLYYWWSLSYCYRNRRYFAFLMIFIVYIYIEITGMFYCRAGSTVSMNIFYIILSILPLGISNFVTISNGNTYNRNTNY